MKLFKYILWVAGIALVLTSCSKELERINKNPNEAESAQPDYLLTNGIKMNVDTYWGTDAAMETSLLYVQYWAKIQYTDPDRYIPASTNIQTVWNNFYAQGVEDFTTLIQLGDTLHNPNYKAVGIIMRSWIFQVLTDLYGDVPYTQTANIEKYLTPKYDNQRDIYLGLLAELKTAAGLINTSGDAISGDVLYSGNMTKWKKFANSLRLRIALRIADQEFDAAKAVFDEIGADNSALIAANSEAAQLVYLASPNQNPVGKNRETRNDYRISKTVVDLLRSYNDPRLNIYAAFPKETNVILGVTNGLATDSANKLGLNKTSDVGAVFTASTAPGVIFNYAELLFIKAEAAQRGLLSGDAADLYNQAITASLKQYNVSDADVATYLAQASVAYDATNYRKSIGEQKWLALFGEGLEGFAEWRRLDYPVLAPAYRGVLGGKIPLRLTYPSAEQALNGANYKAAVAHQGADQLVTRLWFDVR
ncbi:SusD/RagB family nutrient-binding outer membrane lipoprotein [Chitinophaga sancti]|uniref:Starch-binding associating with outer membrane n=1 Tax=Chitinophaga sancti TaxID=1004 RepID=A0A1K1Q5N0_9BACT|nr:SusD/RagB family nutrient-binding outer membrane lipoprotein [Chitinophaga sancti]WQD61148.1 SusD/RagB family nutrient-binding outer membrane lipoprotein [Chitinophaga sancti]WQG86725.1 SusD/RagB family nutrient-binding outer membrane lipoprotein [Chitinophaga sancti]SFW55199.1 Starch-binding associating with outer membrane [Chitinophaga sancti]